MMTTYCFSCRSPWARAQHSQPYINSSKHTSPASSRKRAEGLHNLPAPQSRAEGGTRDTGVLWFPRQPAPAGTRRHHRTLQPSHGHQPPTRPMCHPFPDSAMETAQRNQKRNPSAAAGQAEPALPAHREPRPRPPPHSRGGHLPPR